MHPQREILSFDGPRYEILGRKRIILYPMSAIRHMHNVIGVYTDADPEHPDRSPIDLSDAPRFEVTLCPGDALFVPFACVMDPCDYAAAR